MYNIPGELKESFLAVLKKKGISSGQHFSFLKWLRYFLDFCDKNQFPPRKMKSLEAFLRKLQEKNQNSAQRQQAQQAINLFLDHVSERNSDPEGGGLLVHSGNKMPGKMEGRGFLGSAGISSDTHQPGKIVSLHAKAPREYRFRIVSSAQEEVTSSVKTGVSWVSEFNRLSDEIQVRHYSQKTLKVYRLWLRKFQTFTRSKSPELLSITDVKGFLTFLAIKQKRSNKRLPPRPRTRRSMPYCSFFGTCWRRISARWMASHARR